MRRLFAALRDSRLVTCQVNGSRDLEWYSAAHMTRKRRWLLVFVLLATAAALRLWTLGPWRYSIVGVGDLSAYKLDRWTGRVTLVYETREVDVVHDGAIDWSGVLSDVFAREEAKANPFAEINFSSEQDVEPNPFDEFDLRPAEPKDALESPSN